MKMSKEQYENHMRRISGGARPIVQEQQENSPIRKKVWANNRSKKKEDHERDGQTVSIECTFFVSDKRCRDLDGGVSTVLDCLIDAGLIADDNIYVVSKISAHWVRCKKGEEGVNVKITEDQCG